MKATTVKRLHRQIDRRVKDCRRDAADVQLKGVTPNGVAVPLYLSDMAGFIAGMLEAQAMLTMAEHSTDERVEG